jgi:ABC-type transport system substrate-binding protein
LAGVVVMTVAGTVLAACGATPSRTATATSTSTTGSVRIPSGVTPATIDPGHIVPAPPGPTTLPTEDPITPIRPDFDTGQQAIITSHGFEPLQLSGSKNQQVVWTNVSGSTQRIIITGGPTSPPIPPGAQYVWMPNSGGSIAYRSVSGFHAVLTLQ